MQTWALANFWGKVSTPGLLIDGSMMNTRTSLSPNPKLVERLYLPLAMYPYLDMLYGSAVTQVRPRGAAFTDGFKLIIAEFDFD